MVSNITSLQDSKFKIRNKLYFPSNKLLDILIYNIHYFLLITYNIVRDLVTHKVPLLVILQSLFPNYVRTGYFLIYSITLKLRTSVKFHNYIVITLHKYLLVQKS